MDADPRLQRTIEELQAGIAVEENFQALFHRFRPALDRFFARFRVTADECRDLTQETFLGIYSGIGSFRREARFESWLFTVAANVYRKRSRLQSAAKRAGQVQPLEPAPGSEEASPADCLADESAEGRSPEATLLRSERLRRLQQAVGELPERMRECLVQRVLHDLSYEEIAVAMRLSAETVRSHLFHARRRLKEQLSEDRHVD